MRTHHLFVLVPSPLSRFSVYVYLNLTSNKVWLDLIKSILCEWCSLTFLLWSNIFCVISDKLLNNLLKLFLSLIPSNPIKYSCITLLFNVMQKKPVWLERRTNVGNLQWRMLTTMTTATHTNYVLEEVSVPQSFSPSPFYVSPSPTPPFLPLDSQ